MKSRTIEIEGKTDHSGVFKIVNKLEMNQFFRDWPNSSVIIQIKILPREASKLALARYYMKVVPAFQKAFKEHGDSYTMSQVDQELRKMTPVCIEEILEEDGIRFGRIKEVRELNSSELSEMLDHLEIIGAKNYNVLL